MRSAKVRAIGQIVVSVVGLGLGGYVIIGVPESREWGAALVGLIIGYWIK